MTNQHPIAPPPELVREWAQKCSPYGFARDIATQAAQWGRDQRGSVNESELQKARDQQLEDCCEQLKSIPSPLGIPFGEMASNALRNACRPKPPSLKEQALSELEEIMTELHDETGSAFTASAIRRALEALPND